MIAAILLLGGAGLLVQTALLARRWSAGCAAKVDWLNGLKRLPRAYFKVVHGVVARDAAAARMHTLVAGGLSAGIALTILVSVVPEASRWLLQAAVLISCSLALVGLGLAIARRWPSRPRHLSGGSFDRLPAALAGLMAALGMAAAGELLGLSSAGWFRLAVAAIAAASVAWLVQDAVHGPMRHAVAGIVHLIVHSRPQRFGDVIDSGLKPLDLEGRLGTQTVADIPWNRLVSYDACVQCGRCEVACPAYAAGQPLNPKKLINDLVLGSGSRVGLDYAGSPHPGLPMSQQDGPAARTLVRTPEEAGLIAPDTLWACTTCRACVYECPMLIEHVDAVVDLRRFQTLELGCVPEKVAAALTTMRATDTESGQALAARLDWAAGLDLPVLGDRLSCEVLLWLGDGAYNRRNQQTLRALVHLLRSAEVDFAVLGDEERDSGDLARRLGDEATFQELARANIATLSRYRFDRIVTADPHVLHCLAKEYGDFGAAWPVVHHTTFLDELIESGRLRVDAVHFDGSVTFHDPCYLGRYMGEIAAPRRLLERVGIEVIEMERSGFRSSCCGGGGGAPLSDVPGARRIPDMRMDHARATGATTLAVACPYCTQMLEGVTGPRPAVADVAEILLAAVGGRP